MIAAAVCARAGSEGIPDKNLLELDGVSLLECAILKARRCQHIDQTIVSTDIDPAKWADVCDATCRTVGRPSHLQGPLISKWKVWQYITLRVPDATAIVDIDVSRPLTTDLDLAACIWAYLDSNESDVVMAITDAKKSPYQDLLEPGENNFLRPSKSQGAHVVARQDRPPAYEHGGIYVVSTDALKSAATYLWDVPVLGCHIPWSHTVSIDDPDDWVMVKALWETTRVAT